MVNFVSIWFPRPEHPHHRDYLPCLRLQRESCARLGLRQIVITEPGALDGQGFDTFECDVPRPLMRALLSGQRQYLERGCDADTVLTGADCLALYDPAPVFDGNFDVAGTTHPFTDCILNCGTMFVPKASAPVAARLWREAEARMGDRWGDDQRALAAVLGATLEHGDHRRGGVRVRFLPFPSHNAAPDHVGDGIRPLVAHFRGTRKDWMGEWWRRFLADQP